MVWSSVPLFRAMHGTIVAYKMQVNSTSWTSQTVTTLWPMLFSSVHPIAVMGVTLPGVCRSDGGKVKRSSQRWLNQERSSRVAAQVLALKVLCMILSIAADPRCRIEGARCRRSKAVSRSAFAPILFCVCTAQTCIYTQCPRGSIFDCV